MNKKLVCAIVGIMSISGVNANEVGIDQLRIACQSSEKTLWVERNQLCIPRNPCKSEKFEAYCNRLFKDIQTLDLGYMVLIDIYAQTHGLSCKPVRQDSKLFGQDYVLCDGVDVMVFEFDDIHNHSLLSVPEERLFGYCYAIGGQIGGSDGKYVCFDVSKRDCDIAARIVEEYGFSKNYEYSVNESGQHYCYIDIVKHGGAMEESKF